MIRQLFLCISALLISSAAATAAGLSYPEAPAPNPDHKVVPPQENPYFYVRPDGQAFTLQMDSTSNLTDYLNRHYYDFRSRGMVWSPWDTNSQCEKLIRSTHLWPEYNEANIYRLFNGVNRTLEKYSGYGP